MPVRVLRRPVGVRIKPGPVVCVPVSVRQAGLEAIESARGRRMVPTNRARTAPGRDLFSDPGFVRGEVKLAS